MPHPGEIANMKVGLWNCASGTSGTVNMANLVADVDIAMDECRVLSITAIAGETDSTMQIDNRPAITIPATHSLTVTPNGTVRNPTIVFTGTASYVIEYVTNNFYGSSKGNV